MDHGHPTRTPPPRPHGVTPWVEISAWILAFAILLAARCIPESATPHGEGPQAADVRGR